MKTTIFKTYSDFLNRTEIETNGVSESFAKNNPDYEKENEIRVSPTKFFVSNEKAMEDIKRCAELELKSK